MPKSQGAGLKVGLVFPSTYFVGMSNLGYHVIYRLLAVREDALVERIFYPGPGALPRSIESGRPAGDFDVLAFSCSFDPDAVNLIRFLLQSHIEPLAEHRSGNAPLLLAGGIAPSANPLPLSGILDGFLLGDGEEILTEAFDCLSETAFCSTSRETVLTRLGEIYGVYIPTVHGRDGAGKIPRRFVKDLSLHPTGSAILTPHTEFPDMFLVEVARGCVRGCDFCLTGHLSQGLRLRKVESIIEQIEVLRPQLRRVGLIASEIACHPALPKLCEFLISGGLQVSTSSLEIDRLDRDLLDLLVRGGQKTLTIAPESGIESVRFELNKKISDEMIFQLAAMAGEAGVERLKLYFIVGMPPSPEEEVDFLNRFLETIRRIFFTPGRRRRKEIVASVNPFVPKPHTPWAREAMLPERELKRRIQQVRRQAGRLGGVRVSSYSPAAAALDAMISLGDDTTGTLLVDALRQNTPLRDLVHHLKNLGPIDPFLPRSSESRSGWEIDIST